MRMRITRRPFRPIRRLMPLGLLCPQTGDGVAGVAVAGTVRVRPAGLRLSLHLPGLRRHLKRYNSAV